MIGRKTTRGIGNSLRSLTITPPAGNRQVIENSDTSPVERVRRVPVPSSGIIEPGAGRGSVHHRAMGIAHRMRFDTSRAMGIFEELGDPRFAGPEGETQVADFVADRSAGMGLQVERREVSG